MKIPTAYTAAMSEFDALHATSLLLVGKNKPQFSSSFSSSTKRSTTDDCSGLITPSYTTTVSHRVIPEGPDDEIEMNYNNTSTQQVISSSINKDSSHNDNNNNNNNDDDDETMMSLSNTTTTTKRLQQQQQQHQQDLSGPVDESRWRIHGRERRIQLLEEDKNKGGRSFSLSFDCSVQRYFSVAHWYVVSTNHEYYSNRFRLSILLYPYFVLFTKRLYPKLDFDLFCISCTILCL